VLEWLITERTGADDTVSMWLKTEKILRRSAGNPVAYCIIEKTEADDMVKHAADNRTRADDTIHMWLTIEWTETDDTVSIYG
jgi:hypothetical protein